MSTIQAKILKPKLGLLELAKQLGNVSQAYGLLKRYVLSIQGII
ncbi:hypothetical protein Wcon_00737 [Wolbachia endosymbiont of Cylisticus convexus]|nr:putative transposase [Wolbachia endosymbiont of Cylisticus convexus]RDD33674.1 IS481 family transposase [Wolbachia endosymbiont of Cylisticus convexus]RDD33679.1 putative transposase [Wolbachia endosymbiont of Cylisticus convexus]RDD33682.1 IS481 family transposase [Wolbachia endosymbiont of Cylisticus convexus]RDD33772.1 IS481 family transposase [Wolbachia endosymbiont of Cylisticus convexus]